MNIKEYKEPAFDVVLTAAEDVITASSIIGGEDFNMAGDQAQSLFYKNSNWLI